MKSPKPAAQPLSSSLEDYLEVVCDLVRTGRVARVRDIARRLGVGMPSVSVALKALGERGLVNYDPYQVVTLTPSGERLGQGITRRHTVLQGFLEDVLGVERPLAASNACRMEHAIDDEVLDRLRDFAGFVLRCPRLGRAEAGKRWRFSPACRRCARAPSRAPGRPRPSETGKGPSRRTKERKGSR